MAAYIIVKSDTSLVNKIEFDNWYQKEHLIEASHDFGAVGAKRGWIKDSNCHVAIYKFENIVLAEQALQSKSLKALIKKFDHRWDKKVKRTRELIEINQDL
jgi:hypothetical protein